MRFNVTNQSGSLRNFTAGGRYIGLAGGETERNVEMTKDEADALLATREFTVSEIKVEVDQKSVKVVPPEQKAI